MSSDFNFTVASSFLGNVPRVIEIRLSKLARYGIHCPPNSDGSEKEEEEEEISWRDYESST